MMPGHRNFEYFSPERLVARVEQHDRVDHEHHHRAHVDEHLEGGDEVQPQQAVHAAEEHHAGDERQGHAHRLAQHEHERGAHEGAAREAPEEQRVEVGEEVVDHGRSPFGTRGGGGG